MTAEELLDRMWTDYIALNPQAKQVHDLFVAANERPANDHIALRTLDLDPVRVPALARPFVERGWIARGDYTFPEKKLVATHFEPPRPDLPKVFVSALLVDELPPAAQAILRRLAGEIPADFAARDDLVVAGRPWSVSHAEWETLAAASEYAAWVAAHGFRPNHFTVDVGSLRGFASLEAVNTFLRTSGLPLNTSGGEIKGTPAQLLEQSSTLAGEIELDFSDGRFRVPGCYYEFARRYPDHEGRLYQGFIAASADKIFESTDRR